MAPSEDGQDLAPEGGSLSTLGPGQPLSKRTQRPAILRELRHLAVQEAPEAMATLLGLMRGGPPAVRVQAAKAVLGMAGIPLVAPTSVRVGHETEPLPAVDVKDLLAAVRNMPASKVLVDVTSGTLPEGQA